MIDVNELVAQFAEQWPIWTVSIVLVVAAVIDGIQLKVPNWITFPMIASGWIYSACAYAWGGDSWMVGLGWSLLGTAVGLALLLPPYAVGGMGAGDVKLLAGVGAWIHATDTAYAFRLRRRRWSHGRGHGGLEEGLVQALQAIHGHLERIPHDS